MTDGYDDAYDDPYDDEPAAAAPAYARPSARRGAGGATPLGAGLAGLVIGALLAGIGLTLIGGNPFSDVNDVVYQQVVVADISEQGDVLCWPKDPQDRGSDRSCAILALDPAAAVPAEGERITVGLVRLRPPDGKVVTQAVYARGAAPRQDPSEGEGGEAGETDADADAGETDEAVGDEAALSD